MPAKRKLILAVVFVITAIFVVIQLIKVNQSVDSTSNLDQTTALPSISNNESNDLPKPNLKQTEHENTPISQDDQAIPIPAKKLKAIIADHQHSNNKLADIEKQLADAQKSLNSLNEQLKSQNLKPISDNLARPAPKQLPLSDTQERLNAIKRHLNSTSN